MEEQKILNREIEKRNFKRGGEVSSELKELLRKLGVDSKVRRKAAIVAYEMEMNVIIHSEGGFIKVIIDQKGIKIIASDRGPGIEDLEKALQPGFSTASDEIRELGFGAGMGLNNIKNYSDEFNIESNTEQGTTVEVRLLLK